MTELLPLTARALSRFQAWREAEDATRRALVRDLSAPERDALARLEAQLHEPEPAALLSGLELCSGAVSILAGVLAIRSGEVRDVHLGQLRRYLDQPKPKPTKEAREELEKLATGVALFEVFG